LKPPTLSRRRTGASTALRSFGGKHLRLRVEIEATRNALRRATAAGYRLERQRVRYDMRAWVVKRRERTRHLIELGALVQKSGLVELSSDDRALLYGAFLELTDILKGETREQTIAIWRRRGRRGLKSATVAPATLE
jgi:hypothetical protein